MAKKVSKYGVLIALAFIFSYIERLIPFAVGIPGVKLGLANLVVVVALYCMSAKDAFVISIIRIILVGFTFGNLFSMVYSLSGGILSFLVMALLVKKKWFSVLGVSILGGITHNVGQLFIAMYVVKTTSLMYYFPMLLVAGAVTGLVIGIVASILIDRLNRIFTD